MKVYGVYYVNFNDDNMEVFTDEKEARELFETVKNDLKDYETEFNKNDIIDTQTEYAVNTYDLDTLLTYFVKLKEFEI